MRIWQKRVNFGQKSTRIAGPKTYLANSSQNLQTISIKLAYKPYMEYIIMRQAGRRISLPVGVRVWHLLY